MRRSFSLTGYLRYRPPEVEVQGPACNTTSRGEGITMGARTASTMHIADRISGSATPGCHHLEGCLAAPRFGHVAES